METSRRGFFKFLGGAAVAAALAPPLIETVNRTIFLPPSGGWFQAPLKMREVMQYSINSDAVPVRYDMLYETEGRKLVQVSVQYPKLWSDEKPCNGVRLWRERWRENARASLAAMIPKGAKMLTEELYTSPREYPYARFV